MKCHVNTFNHYATAKDCAGKDVLKSFPYTVAFPFYEALKHPTNRSDPQREDFQYLLGPETMKTKSSTNSPVRKKKEQLEIKNIVQLLPFVTCHTCVQLNITTADICVKHHGPKRPCSYAYISPSRPAVKWGLHALTPS